MGRADRARRERPSRRLSFRPRCPKESGASSSTFARRLLRPAARLSQAAGLALVLAGLLAVPAASQAGVLVSNIEQANNGGVSFFSAHDMAQGFTTGAGTYTLGSIEVQLANTSHTAVAASVVTATLVKDSPTGTSVATLASTDMFEDQGGTKQNITFTAPANTTLEGSTTYYVVLESANTDIRVHLTTSDDEDSGGESDWAINNDRHRRDATTTGSFETVTAAALIRVNDTSTGTNTPATGEPGFMGTPQVGETLTATIGDMADTDLLPTTTFPLGYTFQWVLVDGVTETDITTAMSHTYVPVASDAGKTLKVNVSFTDGGGASETRSAATQPVAAAKTTCPTGYVWCTEMESGYSFLASGTTTIELGGYVPSSSLGSLGDDDFTHAGTAYTVTEINWSRATTSGIVSNTLALVTGAELPDGTVLTLNGTALTVGADSETTTVGRERWNLGTLGIDLDWVTDTKVTTSLNFPNTPATGAPGFMGTPQVGETLTATLGDIADGDDLPTTTFPTGYTFQWVLVDGVTETDIASATSQTYVPVSTDAGKTLKVKVSFTDGGGASETLPSAATQPVAGAKTPCPTSYVWCTEMESGYSFSSSGATTIELGGYVPSSSLGSLDDDDFTHAGTAYTVTEINWSRATTSGVVSNTLALVTGAELPDGTVLTLNGTALTVGADSETTTVGRERWNLGTLGIDFDWVTDTKVTTSLSFSNNPATGAPGITGTPLVGETLTATIGDMADTDLLPTTTFPDGYSFQWVLVDGVTETDIASATSQTYVPVAADAGKTLKVKVTFTDGGGTSETLASEATAAVPAEPEGCSARTHANWCATLTVGVGAFTTYGWDTFSGQGALDDVTIDYGGLPGWSLRQIRHNQSASNMSLRFVTGLVPRDTVFNLGGGEFIADSLSEGFTDGYFWSTPDGNIPAGFVPWVDGQKVTVSANLPPVLVSAEAEDTSLVLTYAENLDTGSVPAADAYSVTVGGGAAANPSNVSIAGNKVTLSLSRSIFTGQTVTVSYAVPASNPVQDVSGLAAAAFGSTDHTVTNNSTVSTDPLSDATLSALELADPDDNPVELTPAFAADVPVYRASVANAVEAVTVTATKNEATAADPVFLDEMDATLTDADGVAAGFQFALAEGDNTIKVRVTAADLVTMETYTVVVTRARPTLPTLPTGGALVSNLNQGNIDNVDLTTGAAQGFTTGVAATLSGVDIVSADPQGDSFTAMLCTTNASGNPTNTCTDLTAPSSFAPGTLRFTAPANTVLTANTTYAVVVNISVGLRVGGTTADGEDAGKAQGWSIANARQHHAGGNVWSNDSQSRAFRIAIHGSATDTTAPTLESAAVPAPGDKLELTFDEDLDISATDLPPASAFTVEADGEVTVTGVTADEYDVLMLSLSRPIYAGETVTVSYTKPDSGKVIEDGADNETATFEDIEVTNGSTLPVPGPAPCPTDANWCAKLTVGISSDNTLYGWKKSSPSHGMLDDERIEHGNLPAWDLKHIQHAGDAISFWVGDEYILRGTVFNLGGSEFVADEDSEQRRTGSYGWTLPAGFVPWVVGQEVRVSANLPPVLVSAEAEDDQLVLTYAEDLDTGSVPAADAYSVTVGGGTAANPSSVGIGGNKVTLTLASAVTSGQAVTVSYAVPASNPVQDVSGLAAAAFGSTDHTVTNKTGTTNNAPTVENEIPDQAAQAGTPFSFTFDDDTFDDADAGDTLTYTAAQDDDSALPTWLSFDDTTRTFSGTPMAADVGTVSVKVTASDGTDSVSDTFDIEVIAGAEACSARTDANWCTTLTAAEKPGGSGTAYGFAHNNYGDLGEGTIDHGRTWEVRGVWIWDADGGTDGVIVDFQTGRVPHGTVFDFGGESFTANAASEHSDATRYRWDRPAGFAWFVGQKVTVSANLPPEVTGVTVNGDKLVLTYAENLDTNSVPAASAYLVSVDSGTAANPSSVGISGTKVTLTLASAATSSSQTVTVSYAVPASNPVQDASGLKAAGFGSSDHTVTNNTGVVDDATLTALTLTAGTDSVDLTPAFASDTENYTATVASGVSQITVAPTFSDSGASADYLDGDDVDIPDDDTVATGQQVALEVGENTIKVKVTAEDGTTMKTYTVTVTRSDTAPPVVSSATVDGDRVTITFDDPLAPAPNLANSAFTVKVTPSGSGTEATVTLTGSPSIDSAKVTLTLASEVAPGDTVTVGYTVPTSGTNNRLEDGSDNEVATFANQPVTNRTTEADKGDTQLTDGYGNKIDPDGGDHEGRLEVFFRGKWGSVCDDRFDRDFDDPGTPDTTKVPNQAAHLACRWAGFETGAMVSNAGKAAQTLKIWLDDVRCVSETDKHWRPAGSPDPTGLHHCYNAGVGLNNCKPEEDVWLECTGMLESATQEEEAALTAVFEDLPGSHDGATPFTFRIVLSEAIANDADDVRDNVVKVTGGSVGSATSVNGQTDEWQITVDPDGAGDITLTVEAGGTCGDPGVLCTAGGEPLSETVTQTVEGEDAGPFTAAFENGPGTHDGASAFNVFLRFSEAPANVKNFNIKAALQISGGTILRVRVVGGAVNGDEAHRRVEIEPSGDADVRLSLFPTTDCTAENALCTSDGRKLESLIGFSVPGPASAPASPPPSPLTASFQQVPEEHDGSSRFNLDIVFSEAPAGMKNEDIRAVVQATNAWKRGMSRLNNVNDAHRNMRFDPRGNNKITISIPATTDCAATGALCTAAGGKLETGISVTIPGPVAISVADDSVEEAAGAVLAFAVTLDRARHATVTVDYATENGTATAGEDYTAASGTLTFAAGETAKTVEVAVLDDLHDEGNETLVLRLSNPSGARIADGEATGTIENTDLMPQAWLARFGRTVAEQVIDAVETRMRAPRNPGAEVSLAGRRIGLGPLFGADAAPEGEAALAARARETEAEAEEGQRRLAAWLRGAAEEEERPSLETQTVTERQLLLGSSFSLTAAPGDGTPGAVSLWGRAAVSRFDGREDGLTLDGEVASGLLGADWARERSTLGLILSHSRGEGGYRGEGGSGTVSSTLTGLYPWGRHALSDRVTVWGVAGYGAGTLTLTPENDDGTPRATIRTDMDLMMAAVGLRGVVVEAPAEGGPELSLKTDALGVRTSSEAVRGSADAGGNLAAAQGDVTRLRLGLEGTWRGLAIGTGTLEPRLEVGVRHDGGDAETGFGLDLGGGLAWSDPGTGIRAEVSGRGLLTHESAGFRQRGIAGSFGWDPTPGSNRGPSLSLTQTMGLSATGGADALLGRTTLEGLAANDDGDEFDRRRLELRLGYGFAAFGDRFTSTPEAGFGMSEGRRDYSLGWRLVRDPRPGGIGSLELLFEGRRQESANDDAEPEHSLGFRLTARF